MDLPDEVVTWVRDVFAACNARVTEKLARNPNTPEESLDQTWIEHLTHYSTPEVVSSGWIVRIETHFLGGMRHFEDGRLPTSVCSSSCALVPRSAEARSRCSSRSVSTHSVSQFGRKRWVITKWALPA
jgi:hypothetical protein